ncbi:MAG: nicotinamide riboside transporter PnuC [Massilibacteroides sp.]|nr:nicotinamide riboside transporter PnuC [Massilibacteroides sp.]MDD3062691.1 nicotinamide riboside transporter PnuC [Massilibacteroides sp.]MDD4115603.1 nicotinamide riboside transporter PnuC [Massilibacteroides sp.]MDD4660184.1 nicotinamide riboside transporter PnuC [Massilibacteroides sp.]
MGQGLEYLGVITGLLYLWLEIKQHKTMWIVGFISSLAYVFIFFFSKFYAVMGLNLYYVLMSVYGFILWSRKKKTTNEEDIVGEPDVSIIYHSLKWAVGLACLLAISALWAAIYFVLYDYTDSPVATGDAFVTALSIVGTWLLARQILEHWYCWIVVNGVSVFLYYSQELYPTMFLYICYTLLSIYGIYNWKKNGQKQGKSRL